MVPQPAYENALRYLDLAALGNNRWWRYLLGVALIVVTAILPVFLVPIAGKLLVAAGLLSPASAGRLGRIVTGEESERSIVAFVLLNLTIIGMIAGLWLALVLLHRRPILSLITSGDRFDWQRMFYACGLMVVLMAAATLVEHLLFPGRYRLVFDAARFFPFMIAVLVMTPLQALAEELVFRGYLMQGLGRLVRSPVLVALVSSAAFAALHGWNPEVERHGLAIMASGYFVIGLLLAALTLRDGRLELAIGVHATNNVFTALVANNEGSVLATESIFLSPLDPVFTLIAMTAIALAFYGWTFGRTTQAE